MTISYRLVFPFLLLLAQGVQAAPAARAAQLVQAAKKQIGVTLRYDPRYEKLAYPGGDVPIERGVCTDVVVRAYRHLGVDLQKLVHEDMSRAWKAYPKAWQLKRPDRNIDHRRVLNLATWFGRHGETLAVSRDGRDYRPGDIVTWMIPPNLPHIGVVSGEKGWNGAPLIVHNVGSGTVEDDVLFAWPITGHYRYLPTAGR
ncbi:DUF1287 domain-containing protein [Massilia sp. PAMC28688]|uniref:DUF1287 domain-containing protein n=1 Tax=Massilia sp. PAMC28688 TaxID=2861283 RepID=UPI001C63A30F|nr:DUF1287 domain-containing protein [Massilia sp. PAMC28688]QYF95260.1 DUF1287 domain-containing protein [Massilia sp. PAMC28688]